MTDTIFLAGATGMFGSRSAHYLFAHPGVRVRLLVRNVSGKKDELESVIADGAERRWSRTDKLARWRLKCIASSQTGGGPMAIV